MAERSRGGLAHLLRIHKASADTKVGFSLEKLILYFRLAGMLRWNKDLGSAVRIACEVLGFSAERLQTDAVVRSQPTLGRQDYSLDL